MFKKKICSTLVATLFIVCGAASAAQLQGKVVRVSDGDTITVLDRGKTQHRIRLTGIDAPESKQDFGEKSRQSLAAMVAGKVVIVEWEQKDRHGRVLGRVITPEGQDANLAQVERGMAWHYVQFAKTRPLKETLLYAKAERSAKAQKLGLWSQPSPTSPWEYRRSTKQ